MLLCVNVTGVYTKNRNFRLYLSSKYGKKNPLVVADSNTYELPNCKDEKDLQRQTLLISLVHYTIQ